MNAKQPQHPPVRQKPSRLPPPPPPPKEPQPLIPPLPDSQNPYAPSRYESAMVARGVLSFFAMLAALMLLAEGGTWVEVLLAWLVVLAFNACLDLSTIAGLLRR